MALDTKLNLNSNKFEQLTAEILNLSGGTYIFGNLRILSGGTISILDNYGLGKILTSDSHGNAVWGESIITGFTNGLTKYDNQNVCLGGMLNSDTIIDVSCYDFTICSCENPDRGIFFNCPWDDLTISWSTNDRCICSEINFGICGLYLSNRCATTDTSVGISMIQGNHIEFMVNGSDIGYFNDCGFHYSIDPSNCNLLDNWLTDKRYVDSKIKLSGITSGLTSSNGCVGLGLPSDIDNTSINLVSGTTHTHKFKSTTFIKNDGGILVDGAGRFYLDDSYVADATLPNLYTITGVTSNQSIGVLESGQTLGMVYITNLGSEMAFVNLGTTPTGDEITPYTTVKIPAGDDVSITVNMRLSKSLNKTIYISSSNWTNVELEIQWANITYQNASTTITPSDLPMASDITLGAIRIGDGISIDGDGIVSVNSIELNNISNIEIISPNIGNVLQYDGSQWVNSDLTISTSLSGLTDVNITTPSKGESLIYDGSKWINTGITTGGGFLGLVTRTSPKPQNLKQNQWVKPRPEDNNNHEYVFTNFCNDLGNPISVNLSLEDVYLRYCENGDYWTKEYYDKPLTYDKIWIGNYDNKVSEMPVIDEWVASESALCHIGQKFAYQTQTVMVSDLDTCVTVSNYHFVKEINLKNVGNTQILTIPSGKRGIINSLKLVMLQTVNPTTLHLSVGNSGGYNNLINNHGISNVCQYETYTLPIPETPNLAVNGNVYFRVVSGSTHQNNLCGHLLVNAFIF